MMKNKKQNGYVIYKGPSMLNGDPIVAIAITKKSTNRKTGDMVQVYILSDNGEKPTTNQQTGADESICGDCKHRPVNNGACYVVTAQGPTMVYKSYLKGNYDVVTDSRHGLGLFEASKLCQGRMVRLGAYGDPAAVPGNIWEVLLMGAKGVTGYTHQWKNPALSNHQKYVLKRFCMASTDNQSEYSQAKAAGWRSFRVRLESDELNQNEIKCPASSEAGKKLNCLTCGACNGLFTKRRGDIAIITHGFKARRYHEQRVQHA